MIGAYSFSFLLIFLLGGLTKEMPQVGYRITPGITQPLPYDATRLAPWAADYSSRRAGAGDATGVEAPRPMLSRSMFELAASEPSTADLKKENEELRQRLNQLEQMMKGVVSQPPVPAAPSPEAASDRKSVPGWTVELYPWNKAGKLAPDPKRSMLTQNCEFNGGYGQTGPNELNIYRFMGIFRAKEEGRYVFTSDLVCEMGHNCGFQIFVDDQPLVDFRNDTKGSRLVGGIPLTPGDHKVEFRTWLLRSTFMKTDFRNRYRWRVLVKTPSDFTQRDFREDELFSVIPRSLNMGSRSCAMN